MYTAASCSAAPRALRSMQQLLGTCGPLPGAAATCGLRRMQLRAFIADAAEQLAREDAPGSSETASRNARVFTQVMQQRVAILTPAPSRMQLRQDTNLRSIPQGHTSCRTASPVTVAW